MKKNRNTSGFVLVLVLMVVSLLTTIAVSLAYRTRVEMRLVEAHAQHVKAYHLALGGIARALVALENKEPNAVGTAQLGWFTQSAAQEELFGELPIEEPEAIKLITMARDEQGCLNINGQFADRLEFLLNRETAACLLDWIDDNNDTTGYEGADTDYYEALPYPYQAKNESVYHLRELLYIKGINPSNYRGNWLQGLRLSMKESAEMSMATEVANLLLMEDASGLAGLLTTYGDDLININTACPQVLAALGGLDQSVIEALFYCRAGPDQLLGTEDDQVLSKASDLQLPGLTDIERHILSDTTKFCFDSKFFRVYTLVETEETPYCLMATLDGTNAPKIVALERLL